MATENVKLILKLGVKCMTLLNSTWTRHFENHLPFYSSLLFRKSMGGLIKTMHFFKPHFSKTPNNGGLAKLLEVCPFTDNMNLALTVKNYLEYSDKIRLER